MNGLKADPDVELVSTSGHGKNGALIWRIFLMICFEIIAFFQVCDSILNVGPCGHVAMGQPSFLSEELQSTSKADPDVELVSTSGHFF